MCARVLSSPTLVEVVLLCVVNTIVLAIYGAKTRFTAAYSGAFGAIAYIAVACTAAALMRLLEYFRYTGQRPFFEDGLIGEIVVIPLCIFGILAIFVAPCGFLLGMLIGRFLKAIQGSDRFRRHVFDEQSDADEGLDRAFLTCVESTPRPR